MNLITSDLRSVAPFSSACTRTEAHNPNNSNSPSNPLNPSNPYHHRNSRAPRVFRIPCVTEKQGSSFRMLALISIDYYYLLE